MPDNFERATTATAAAATPAALATATPQYTTFASSHARQRHSIRRYDIFILFTLGPRAPLPITGCVCVCVMRRGCVITCNGAVDRCMRVQHEYNSVYSSAVVYSIYVVFNAYSFPSLLPRHYSFFFLFVVFFFIGAYCVSVVNRVTLTQGEKLTWLIHVHIIMCSGAALLLHIHHSFSLLWYH